MVLSTLSSEAHPVNPKYYKQQDTKYKGTIITRHKYKDDVLRAAIYRSVQRLILYLTRIRSCKQFQSFISQTASKKISCSSVQAADCFESV